MPSWGHILPRSPGLPCCWFLLWQAAGQGPSPAVLRLSGKPGWQQRGRGTPLAPQNLLPPLPGSQRAEMPQGGEMEGSAPQLPEKGWGMLPRCSQMLLGT